MKQGLLEGLFQRRLIGEHGADFALTSIENIDPSQEGGTEVFSVYLHPLSTHPYIKNGAERKKSIDAGVQTWGAAGYCPIVKFADGSSYIAALYRDSDAPSWPDTFTPASGLSHLIDDKAERIRETGDREYREELIFINGKQPGAVIHDGTKYVPLLNEITVPQRRIDDRKTRIDVYQDDKLIDVVYPFAIAWGTPSDTVTTVIDVCVLYPGDLIPPEYIHIANGEIVGGGEIFTRTVALLGFDGLMNGRTTPIIKYKTNVETDELSIERSELGADKIKMAYPLQVAIDKLRTSHTELDI
ncbi:MAG: hypothetical protein ISS93_02620 [Candidatus Aenigmarchaeota archaeon]|nr:hypothetical protein [Candidatus Aenigmarchaeota archaeon]